MTYACNCAKMLSNNKIQVCMILLAVLVPAVTNCVGSEATYIEHQIPRLFSPFNQPNQNKVKIVSEIIDGQVGYQISEEYVDLEHGCAALMLTSHKSGQQVVLSDARFGRLLRYQPYDCQKFELADKVFDNLNDWSVRLSGGPENRNYIQMADKTDPRRELRLFGVAAFWQAAVWSSSLKYSKKDLIYGASKGTDRISYSWTMKDKERNLLITFYFMDPNHYLGKNESNYDQMTDGGELSLELIQIRSSEITDKIIRTINILSIDYNVDGERTFGDMLQFPVGYGCPEEAFQNDDEVKRALSSLTLVQDLDSTHFELEVTETRMDDGDKSKQTKTVNVQLAHTPGLVLTRIKNEHEDVRIILNRQLNVKYKIDMLRADCEMSHFKGCELDDADADRVIRFSNESALSLDNNTVHLLFEDREKFYYAKGVAGHDTGLNHLYFERSTEWPLSFGKSTAGPRSAGQQVARIIRTFIVRDDEIYLKSVTIWLLNTDKNRIVKSYHLNVISSSHLDLHSDVPQLFDVSEECYLNNKDMQPGRDYAWMELFYPSSSRTNELLGLHELDFRKLVYERLLNASQLPLSNWRLPQLQIMFEDEGIQVRVLAVDNAPLELVYDELDESSIHIDKEAGDSLEIVSDISHCTQLCRLHACKAMSFCPLTRACLVGVAKPANSYAQTLNTNYKKTTSGADSTKCKTYLRPDGFDFDLYRRSSLQDLVSRWRDQDYGAILAPKAPDELELPRSQTGISEEQYQLALADYRELLYKFMKEDAHRVPELSLLVDINQHLQVLTPTRFSVEDDPLNELDLIGHEASDTLEKYLDRNGQQLQPYFHDGLSVSRFKWSAFSGELRAKARLLVGLSYDQCSLACLDTKCGLFSYCANRKECIVTNMTSTHSAYALGMVEQDLDCFIAQRDFLRNFNKFDNVYRPQLYQKQSEAKNPSQCALACVAETEFNCLSFEFCAPLAATGAARQDHTCFYHAQRHPGDIYDNVSVQRWTRGAVAGSGAPPPACDHYERSSLADFVAVERRQLAGAQLASLRTTTYAGRSVFECADVCFSELGDCTAFQFCLDADVGALEGRPGGAMQNCTMIQSRPEPDESGADQFGAIIDGRAGDRLVSAGKYLVASENCHVFALRRDSSAAQLRDLALADVMTLDQRRELDEAGQGQARGALTPAACLLLFACVSLGATVLGFIVRLAHERNNFIRQRIDRVRLLLAV